MHQAYFSMQFKVLEKVTFHCIFPHNALSVSVLHFWATAEIQHCLVSAGDVGCGVFECFENNSCEIRGLQEICMTFLHNAGKFDSQVKTVLHVTSPNIPRGSYTLNAARGRPCSQAQLTGIALNTAPVSCGAGGF